MNTINEENRNVTQENRRVIVNPSIPVLIIKVLITILFMSPLIHYSIYQKNSEHDRLQNATSDGENSATIEGNVKQTQLMVNKTMKKMVVQPSCPSANQQSILQRICLDLYLKYEQCTPDDFTNLEKHKLPKISINNKNNNNNTNSSESRGMIISCFIGGLLLTSLGAAIVELYKAKYQQYTDDKQKLKTLMNRKCSLADLTVLKHNRKELMRRDSIMDIPEMGNGSTPINNKQLMGRKVSRPPLRLD